MSSSTESKRTNARTKTRWSSSIALSKTQPATTSSKKKQLNKKSNNKSSTTRVQTSTSIIDTDVQTNNDTSPTAFLDDLVVANYNLKEHTKKLERDFNSLQQDVARLSEHGRQLRIELRASEATKGELSANISVLQEEVSATLEESAKHQDHARRTSMDNKRLAAELRAAKTIADGAMERAEKAEAAVFDSLSSVELAETRIDELKTNLLRSQLKHEIMEKELKQLRLVEKDLATLHWSLDEKEKNLTDRNTQTHEWVPEWMTEMVDEHDGNLAAGATATAVETGMMTASSLLRTSPFRRSVSRSDRLGRSQPQSQETKTSTPLKSIETLGQAVVQHLVESGLLQSAINITAPSSLLPSNVSMQTSPRPRSSVKKSSSSSRKKLNSTIDDNSREQEEILMEQKKELAEKRKAMEKKLKRENATLRAQLKQSKMKKMKVEKVQNVMERSKTKNKSSRRKEKGDKDKGDRKERVREKEREKIREKTREKKREQKRQKGKEKERQKETMSWPSRSRSSSASSVSSSSSSNSGSSSSYSQSRSSYSSSGSSSSGSSRRSGSSVSSIAESAITEGDALEMLRRFDSEYARVMATGDQREQKKQREERKERKQQSSMQSSMMQSSMQLSESNLNESNSMSIPRPESSPLRREKGNDSMMSSKIIRSPNDKNTKKSKTAKRPNDKERRRKRKYKSLKTSKAAVRVYRSVGKKRPGSATNSSGGKWR